MFYALIKHRFLTNQSTCRVLSILIQNKVLMQILDTILCTQLKSKN